VTVEVELHVPEAVDRQHGRLDAGGADLRLGQVEACERIDAIGGPELGELDPEREVRGRRREEIAPWNVRETDSSAYSGFASSCATSMPPNFSAAGMSSPLSGPTWTRPDLSRSASARLEPPTPGSTTARWTPAGMNGSEFASASAPCSTPCGGIPCVMSMISASGAIPFMTP
jgi:hypothetical protein